MLYDFDQLSFFSFSNNARNKILEKIKTFNKITVCFWKIIYFCLQQLTTRIAESWSVDSVQMQFISMNDLPFSLALFSNKIKYSYFLLFYLEFGIVFVPEVF